ncbi:competence protein ComEC [Nakamurella panacisegetis]|uniref:Competence protein ComEC n=1 Tax=Nakamurella panacisegetis TaxID=1090615 RepID=A0A1H0HTX5_9ACTN|nr:ComEC/Rec2 family competence protein [Nakamurella panacisegetis]SDO22662.1 competence protein ComEC [Nakamurella panacisegetis]
MTRRWKEEDAPVPVDLRLMPMALAVWAGALVGLALAERMSLLQVTMSVAAAAITVAAAALTRKRWWTVGAVMTAGFGASLLVSVLQAHAAADNPLTVAGANGSWATLRVTVSVPARAIQSSFPATDSATERPAERWLLTAHADSARIGTVQFEPGADVSLMADGPAWPELVPGEQIEISGLLAPDGYAVLPGTMVKVRGDPVVLAAAPWWQRAGAAIRKHLGDNAAQLSGDARGLLPGLVVGDTDGIPAELTADAKATGLTHLLAVSGSHFALLCGVAVLLLRRAGPRPAVAGGAAVLLGLVVLVGPGASVLRAAVMGSVALVALLVGRARSALPALAAAVIGLLLYDPTLSRSVGFALSVQATAGLVLIAPVWSKALQRRGFPSGWADLLAVPAAAHVATMPVIAALSGAISLSSIPANLLAALVVGPALVIGMACAVAGPWWPGGAMALARIDQPLLQWIAFVAHRLARWEGASLPWPASVPGVLGLAGLLLTGLLLLRQRRIRALAVAVVTGAGVILVPAQVISLGWPPPGWVLVGCEVGQGDAMVLSTGEPGTAIVVDAGPDAALMDACLRRLKIGTVPLVVLTHLHADHVDGLAGVLAGRSVGAIAVGPDRDSPSAWRTINDRATAKGIPVVGLPRGTHWASGDLAVDVLGPTSAFRGTDSDENNDSVVLMARIAGLRILMTGDVQNEAQQQLLDNGADLSADVLEQPHHGSAKILPTFIAAVHPQVSVIGVGRDNDYGQPSPKALAQLSSVGAQVLRTDLQGDAAVCVIDGQVRTVTRGAVLPAGSGHVRGGNDGA